MTPLIKKPKITAGAGLTPPEPPPAELATETSEDIKRQEAERRRRRRGRGKTKITGALAPEVVGKKTLLG